MKVQSWNGNEFVSIYEVIEFLNELLQIDSDTINKLLTIRVPCNEDLAKQESVQVQTLPVKDKDKLACDLDLCDDKPKTISLVGILGIINGMFGINSDKFGPIMILINKKTGKAIQFGLIDAEKMHSFKQQELAFKARQAIKKALPGLNRPLNNKDIPNDRRLGDEKKNPEKDS